MSDKTATGRLSDLHLAVNIRSILAKMDSGEPFWLLDDTRTYRPPGGPDHILCCYIGDKEIGRVSVWSPVSISQFNGSVLMQAFDDEGKTISESVLEAGYIEQVAEAKALIEKKWRGGKGAR